MVKETYYAKQRDSIRTNIMLKLNDSYLLKLLNLLDIQIKENFDEANPFGYYQNNDVESLSSYATNNNLFFNVLSENEIILSKEQVCLGRRSFELKDGIYTRYYYSITEWENLKQTYEIIKSIPGIPTMSFPKDRTMMMPELPNSKQLYQASVSELHRNIFLSFLYEMNNLGYVHRDLHCKNIIVSEKELIVIDWDFVTKQVCKIKDSYDLTGYGLTSPHKTNNSHIFKSYPNMNIPSVAEKLGINWKDFK